MEESATARSGRVDKARPAVTAAPALAIAGISAESAQACPAQLPAIETDEDTAAIERP